MNNLTYPLPVIGKLANNVQCSSQCINGKNTILVATLYAVLRKIYGQQENITI